VADIDAPVANLGGFSEDRVHTEVRRIAAAPDFARAPVMRRLLDFLVGETLAGRGELLKAYAVAVDGLGRPADFDAQADSYPRVQVGRLRRMLDAFYARDPNAGGIRLSIPQGRYRVEFAEGGIAETGADIVPPPHWRAVHGALLVIGLLLMLALLVPAVRSQWPGAPRNLPIGTAPTLALAHLTADPAYDALEVDVDAILLDGLRRSWLVAVLPQFGVPAAHSAPRTIYALSGEISGGRTPVASLRLVRAATGEVLWTGQAQLPPERNQLHAVLDPLIAELIQPYGVIATDQRSLLTSPVAPGYPCQLKFDQYRRERTAALHAESRACAERTLAIEPSNAMALAASAHLTLDDELYRFAPGEGDTRARALVIARRAVAADPYSAFAHIVLARASRHTGGCPVAIRSARRAMVLNPNDPDLLAIAANQLYNCGDAGAEAAARRAIALDPSPPANFFMPLVFLALDHGDIAAARALTRQMVPGPNAIPGYYDMVFAVVAAAAGDKPAAAAAWARLSRADPTLSHDPAAMFRRWSLSPRAEAKSLAYLRAVGLVAPVSPPAAMR